MFALKNDELAELFEKMADILDFKGELAFKVNAYRKASRIIKNLDQDIETIWQAGELRSLPGIGDAFVKKIDEFFRTGKISKYEELAKEVSPELMNLLSIQNLGPKTLALAHHRLKVNNINDLIRVIDDGSLANLPGMGQKKVENIRKGIQIFLAAKERISIAKALPIVEDIIGQLKRLPINIILSPAGSVRRMKETVGDIDILATSDKPDVLIKTFIALPEVKDVLAAGETKASVRYSSEQIQVDLRVVPFDSFGAAQQYFTGSQAHNIRIRGIAKKLGLKVNEYGVFRNEQKIAGESEQEVYAAVGLPWIPPEMREDNGEIELAMQGQLPVLVEMRDIQGDLHVHSNYSDGHSSIEALMKAAKQIGYKYLAICDHSQRAKYAQGLTIDRLKQQISEIEELNKKYPDFKILKGIEVDILNDGSLDCPNDILMGLDIVIASIHSGFSINPTERILKALEHPYVDIIGHPTGRLISQRSGYEIDLEKILEKAKQFKKALEINAYPDRLDLSDIHARKAMEMGIMLAINTDAHKEESLNAMRYGIGIAKRAWLTKANVLNCFDWQEIVEWKKARSLN